MKQPERLQSRGEHIVAAGGQELCECEQKRAAIFEHDGKVSREKAEQAVLFLRNEWFLHNGRCDSCPRAKG